MTTPILQPNEWGMRWARSPVPQILPAPEVYIHQTAGRDPVETFPSGDDEPADAFRALNEWAIEGKGYSAVDYSMMVHTGPSMRTTIGVARGQYMPAATLDRNDLSKAVCLLGWFGPPDARYPWTTEHSRAPFVQELVAIAEAVVHMVRRGWVRPDCKILGHRDNPEHPNATSCPGDFLQAELPIIRNLVRNILDPPKPPEESDVKPILWRPTGYLNVFIIDRGEVLHASPALLEVYGLQTAVVTVDPHPQTLRSVLAKAGLTEADLVKG